MNLTASCSVAIIALVTGLSAGAYYTARYKDYQLDVQRIAAMEQAVNKEILVHKNIQTISHDYDQRIAQLDAVVADTTDELGRLRIKRCTAVPEVTTTPATTDAVATRQSDGDREIEINLDRAAAEIIRLGGDLDKANNQIKGLQATIRDYLTVAGGN
ncbi:hypothetical protein [Nitrosomonas sp.]|uniref:hypothetical protein n=1 Tax=Nitrosomonas sp. TaxID=42353 RepID=UPI0037C6730F